MTPPAHGFTHEAMNTTFSLRIRGSDESLVRDMARECCERLDFLESRLSRFIDGSDVSRINRMRAGETLYIGEECHRCLLAALEGHARTGGLFDITLGRRIAHRKSHASGEPPPLVGLLTIHPDVPAVSCEVAGREIDLGGIGKGFALDELKDLLLDWGAEGGLLTAGASSLLAFDPDAWPVDLAGTRRIALSNQALSASGTGIQGSHIVHPAGDGAMPANRCRRLWVTGRTATLAEIWSTALMLVEPDAIPGFIAADNAVGPVYIDRGGGVERV